MFGLARYACMYSALTNIGTLGKYEQMRLWNKSALLSFYLSFKKFTRFQPIIEVKQLKVGGGDLNKCFL